MGVGRTGHASARTLKQRLLSGGAWTVGARVVAGAAGFSVNALLSRLVSPEDLGSYFLLVSIASLGALAAQLGLQVAVVRMVAEAMAWGDTARARGVMHAALAIVAGCALVLGIAVAWAGPDAAVYAFNSSALGQTAWLAGAWLAGLALMNLVAEIFRGLHDYRLAGVLGGAGSNVLLLVALLGVLALQGSASLQEAAGLGVCAVVIAAVGGLLVLRRRASRFSTAKQVSRRDLLAVGLPLLVTSLAIFVCTQADLWILGMSRDKEEVAMYGAAVRLVQLVMMPMLMINAVLAPTIAELFSQGQLAKLERMLRASAALSGLTALVALVVLCAGADPLLGWVYGDYYRGGALALMLVSAGQTVNVLTGPAVLVLMMTGHQRAAMGISLACGAGLIALGLAVVEESGFNGVAAVAAAMTALHGLASAAWVLRTSGMRTFCGFRSIAEMARELTRLARNAN
jgi:O-antigen/teichoic acid export membrane protein